MPEPSAAAVSAAVPAAADGVVPAAREALAVDVRAKRFRTGEGGVLHALGRVRFALPEGSFTCLVGPSGCGKTTTLSIVLGLDADYEGEVRLGAEGRVAAVFQEPRLLPWRSVEDNVRLALPDARRDAPLDDLFEALGLAGHRGFFPAELSLGLARRAALARAFAQEPALLVLDEPFVSLDAATASRLRELLGALWRARPTTALMVTHDLDEAVLLADRVIALGGSPATVLGEVALGAPRAGRDAAWREAAAARVRRAMAGDGDPGDDVGDGPGRDPDGPRGVDL